MTLKKTTIMILTIAISTMISLAIILIATCTIVVFFAYVVGRYLSSVKVVRKSNETVDEVPGMIVDANGLADMKMLAWYKDLKFFLNHTNCNNDLMYCSASITEFEAAFMYMPGAKDLLNELINTYDAIKNKVAE